MVTLSELTYVHFWILPVIALGIQIVTFSYLMCIRRSIGHYLYRIFLGMNIFGFVFIISILYGLWLASLTNTIQPLELLGFWFGFVYPIGNSILHFLLKRYFKRGLTPFREHRKEGSPI